MVSPGIPTVIAAARQVVVRQLFIILIQNVLIDRLVVVFMHQHRRRHTRFHFRVVVRPAKAQAKQRQYVLRELQQRRHRIDIIAQPANIDAAEAKGFRRHQRILRQKSQYVVEHCDFIRGSYKDKMLHFVLQAYPRDELFEIAAPALADTAEGMVSLNERPRVRLFARTDDFKRYVSAIVYLPREQFNTELRQRVRRHLAEAFAATESDFAVQLLGESPLARLHFVFRTHASTLPDFNTDTLEQDIHTMVRGWHSDWQQLAAQQGLSAEQTGPYEQAFSAGYRENFSPAQALEDIRAIQVLDQQNSTAMRMGLQPGNPAAPYWLKMYFNGASPSLSKTLPIIENLGLSVYAEEPYRIRRNGGEVVGLSHFSLSLPEGLSADFINQESTRSNMLALLDAVWQGRVENDRFNALVAAAGITWRDSVLMRALAKFLKQATLPFGQPYVEQCLMRHGAIVANLVALFHARLHPVDADEACAEALQAAVKTQLADVPSLDEDRILNAFMTVILAIERTNFWQPDAEGKPKQDISFKIRSAQIDFLPKQIGRASCRERVSSPV